MPYPVLMILEDSEPTVDGGVQADRATNGMLKVRRLYEEDKTDFVIVHMLTRAELETLMAFYGANKTAQFSFYWPGDGATYTCVFTAPPQPSRRGMYYRVTVRLGQV